MSILYCDFCDKHIDTDFDSEHYSDNQNCFLELINDLENGGLTDKEIEEITLELEGE